MKVHKPRAKVLIALLALVVIILLLAYPFTQLRPPKPIVRHVNPLAETERLPLPTFLMPLIAGFFNNLISGDYGASAEQLKALGMIYVPEGYKFASNRFMELLNKAIDLLNDTEVLLNQSEALIVIGKGGDARPLLDEASTKLTSANATSIELKRACEELAKTFGLPIDELSRKVDELTKVIERLYKRLLKLRVAVERQAVLQDTYLVIDVEPKTVWTGGSVEVSGKLYATEGPLAWRRVQICVDEKEVVEVTTCDGGEFRAKVVLPYIYKPDISVQARYVPKGSDAELYKPSTSNVVKVSLLYVKPIVKVEAVGEALPGKAFVVRGSVEADRPLPYSTVRVSWIKTDVAVSLENGRFIVTLYTPEDVAEGEYSLKVQTPVWQLFAPAEASVKVVVRRLPLNATIQPPAIVLAGLPSSFEGRIWAPEKLNATVKVVFADLAYEARSSGEFELSLTAPLTSFSGYRDYEVYVSPDLPWYRSAVLRGSVLVINPLTVLAPLALASALVLKLSRGRAVETRGEEVPLKREAQPPIEERFVAPGLERLVDMYWQAVAIVSSLTGVEMKPSMTVREYLEAIGPRLGSLKSAFETLSIVAEKALYAPSVSAEELKAAEEALEELKVAHVRAQP